MRFPLRVAGASAVTLALLVPSVAGAQSDTPPPAPTDPPVTTPEVAPGPTIKAGVTANGVPLEGQTREQAIKSLTKALKGTAAPKGGTLVVRVAGRPHTLSPERLGWRWNAEAAADRALAAKSGRAVVVPVGWDEATVGNWVVSLSKMKRSARDAKVTLRIKRHALTGSKTGWRVERSSLRKRVGVALGKAADGSTQTVTQPVIRIKPSVTANGLRARYSTVVTVDRKTFQLRLFKRLKWVKTYKIAVGKAGHGTPAGMYSVTSRQINPAWYVPNSGWAGSLAGQVIPGGAPNNPLKARWIGLRDGIGIHGTSETWSLGSNASHGCIRMHPNDVIELYPRVPMGTTVKVR